MPEVGPMAEVALDIAEKQWLPEILSEALNTKAVVAIWLDHPEEAFALLTHALRVALENDVPAAALRAYGNLAETLSRRDRFEDALETYLEAIALARRVGNRTWETYLHIELTYVQMQTGRWDQALETADQLWARTEGDSTRSTADTLLSSLPEIYSARGEVDQVESLRRRYADSVPADDVQAQGVFRVVTGLVALLGGRHDEAFELARHAIEARNTLGWGFQGVKQGFVLAVEAAIAGGNSAGAEEVLELLAEAPPAQVSPFYQAHRDRFLALLAVARRESAVADAGFKASIGMFRELGLRPRVAMTQVEYGEWLVAQGRTEDARPLLAAARETLEPLLAEPWLARLSTAEHALGLAPASS
jgi:tetratricopeptide (TPR) repeat protein